MPDTLVTSAALVIAAALSVGLAIRARKSAKPFVRWGASSLAIIFALTTLGSVAVAGVGQYRLRWHSSPNTALTIEGSPERYERGRALAASLCSACHKDTLTGGSEIGKKDFGMIGSFVAANLTPVGRLRQWSDGEIFQAIRHSVDPQGRRLTMMSLIENGNLSDDDTRAIVAYIRRLPGSGSASREPNDRFTFIGLVMVGAGLFPSGHRGPPGVVTAPPKGPTYAYGKYILSYWACRNCHGAALTGGVPGQIGPIGPDLTVVKDWSAEAFIETLRTGRDPNGHVLGKGMPWQTVAKMDDVELRAIYEYLKQIPKAAAASVEPLP